MQLQLFVVLFCANCVFSRNINSTIETTTNYPIATTEKIATEQPLTRYEKGLEDYDEAVDNIRKNREGRGMMEYDDHPNHDHDHEMKEMVEQKAVKSDPWAGYYDFIINEGSFKFWAVFQLSTALLLIYSACAAVYYAKFNPIATTDYDYYDDFFFRSNNGRSATSGGDSTNWFGLDAQTFQRIVNAITSKKYV